MSRVPVQVSAEVKEGLEGFREKFRLKTLYETIDRLMNEFRRAQMYEENQREKILQEQERQKSEDVRLGEELKGRLLSCADDLGLSPDEAVEFLLAHYESSPSVDKTTFTLFRSLRK
ncbi:hypothetical protein [Brevibacillus sp. DP1.3A]|uniref:hypothetical protein n=1 Tax=Brevibacillus sp. DP1.3A TaxID=2738867 RepID=UPI00156AC9A7|nr:hypothetical protein [Brevibacillus sp. DP1.3A]UED78125.1 hypothetical protein HP399_030975 [Brevibacillus sp. DP1.3A]